VRFAVASSAVLPDGTREALISFDLLRDKGILVVKPHDEVADLHRLAEAVDPYIADQGMLLGLLIDAPSFPEWESLAALIERLSFVRDHHKKIRRVAACRSAGTARRRSIASCSSERRSGL
jgi:hypothetical protein